MGSSRERDIEQKLVKAVKAAGGICPKFVSPGTDGMPDRIILLPGGRIGFAEVKSPGKKPRVLQVRRHRQIRKLGFPVFVLDDPEQIPVIIGEVTEDQPGRVVVTTEIGAQTLLPPPGGELLPRIC